VSAQHAERGFEGFPESAFYASDPKSIDNILCEPEWHHLWLCQGYAFIEQTPKIYLNGVAAGHINEHILAVSITQTCREKSQCM